jgi:hypothetical protein
MQDGRYSGQKLMKLVRIKIPAMIDSIIVTVPEMTCKKYNAAITKAASILMVLSTAPIFF